MTSKTEGRPIWPVWDMVGTGPHPQLPQADLGLCPMTTGAAAGSTDQQPASSPPPTSTPASTTPTPSGHLRPVDSPELIPTKPCPAGHPNNPDSGRCRVCGVGFDSTTEIEDRWPAPPARLLLEDGSSIDLVTDLLIGRCPTDQAGRDTLTVTGPQVSRLHLVIEVDGWHVSIRDQGSTNGTYLTRRGERGRRRVPEGESMPVQIGDTIHFGSRQALVVQVSLA